MLSRTKPPPTIYVRTRPQAERLAQAREAATVEGVTVSIAHEISQPLISLSLNLASCLCALKKPLVDLPMASLAAERAEADVNRLREIVRSMRQPIAHLELVDLREILDEACMILEHDIVSHAAIVRRHVCDDVHTVWASRTAVVQILVNLIINGLQAMTSGDVQRRELRIYASSTMDEHVVLAVWDSGHGIPEERMARLFQPFFTTKRGGMGLGLSISRSLIEAMGGSITARNHRNGGAVFECTLRTNSG